MSLYAEFWLEFSRTQLSRFPELCPKGGLLLDTGHSYLFH